MRCSPPWAASGRVSSPWPRPSAIGVQLVVAIAVAAAGVVAVRPAMSRTFHQHRGGQVARGVHGGLVGQEALTLDQVGSLH